MHPARQDALCLTSLARMWQDTIVACRQQGDKLVLANLNSAKYQDKTFELDPGQV